MKATHRQSVRFVLLCFVFAIFSLCLSFPAQSQQTEQSFTTTVDGGFTGYYLQYLPVNYDANPSVKYPTIFFLHGIEEKSSGKGVNQLHKLIGGAVTPPALISQGNDMPFIVLSLQLPSGIGNWPYSYTDEFVEHIINSGLRVDTDRLYLTGLSLGGGGVWNHAQQSLSLSSKWAAIAPIAATQPALGKACNISNAEVAVWAFHGLSDGTTDPNWTINMFNAINSCNPAPTKDVDVTLYSGVGHNSWSRAYNLGNTYHDPNLYEWFLQQTRSTESTLPIELVNFYSETINDRILFSWVTASETNNDYFTLEKSKDGLSWSAFKKITGSGNSNKTLYYEAYDSGPFSGTTYYRLKQTDYDGQFSFSEVISVVSIDKFDAYPNPVRSTLFVRVEDAKDSQQVQLINSLGQTIKSLTITNENNIIQMIVDDLESGIYYLHKTGKNNSALKIYIE